jgi:uncharacterized protein DUF6544
MFWTVAFDCLLAVLAAILALSLWSALAARETQSGWRSLTRNGNGARFHLEMLEGLPEPARRYFLHAIQPGTALAASVELQMTGFIRLFRTGDWRPLRASEMLCPPHGFVFRASTGGWPRIVGHDIYRAPAGVARWIVFGLFPVMRASGPGVSRSARGRMAGELIFLPSALLPQNGVEWSSAGADTAEASFVVDGEPYRLALTIAPDGVLRSVVVNRWGDVETEDGKFHELAFGGTVSQERTFGGYTIPTRLNAGWRPESDSYFEFFRLDELTAVFR